MIFDGEDPPEWDDGSVFAMEVANMLRTGTGGIDWQSLPFLAWWLDVKDCDMLCRRLRVILLHRPPPIPGE